MVASPRGETSSRSQAPVRTADADLCLLTSWYVHWVSEAQAAGDTDGEANGQAGRDAGALLSPGRRSRAALGRARRTAAIRPRSAHTFGSRCPGSVRVARRGGFSMVVTPTRKGRR